jgi:hypothetical protein
MKQEISALDELKGRLTFLQIEYIDTGIRIRPALTCIQNTLNLASKGPLTMQQVDELGEELSNLRGYLVWLKEQYPVTTKDVDPVIAVIDWLLTGEQKAH